ncbi:MAG: polysaccharide deacetylase family protein [bacterium]
MLYIFITVDTEGTNGNDPFEQLILGKTNNNGYWGVGKIIDLADPFDYKVTFFVDVYEQSLWGKEAFKKLCLDIKQRGHDVQLHAHPGWSDSKPVDSEYLQNLKRKKSMYDCKRAGMSMYSYEDQIKIIKDGIEMIETWTGRRPVAFRCGGYHVNDDTIKALCSCGLFIDSSMFWNNSDSKINWSKNKIIKKKEMVEIPVTLLEKAYRLKIGKIKIKRATEYLKTDINWLSLDELKSYVRQALKHNLKAMTLFMHSYSLIKPASKDKIWKTFDPDHEAADRLTDFFKFLKNQKNIKVLSVEEFASLYKDQPDFFTGSDYLPKIDCEYGIRDKIKGLELF